MRRRAENDSMELLLDTICNVFGGILFLALLVCILATDASQHVKFDTSPDEVMASRVAYRKAEIRLAHLKQAILSARAQRDDRAELLENLVDDSNPSVSRDYRELVKEMAALGRDRHFVVREAAAAAKALEQVQKQRAEARHAVAQAEKARDAAAEKESNELAEARAVAKAAQAQQVVRLRLPKARVTFKQEVGFFVCGGRLHMPFRYNAAGVPVERDPAEVTRLGHDEPIAPSDFRPRAGLELTDADRTRTGINRRLAKFRPSAHYITLVVWPDSYAQFRLLRDHIVEQGYEYRLLLMDDNEPVGFGDVVPRVQ